MHIKIPRIPLTSRLQGDSIRVCIIHKATAGKRKITDVTIVEYAMEAISHAGTVLAVLSKEGIAMAAEKVRI